MKTQSTIPATLCWERIDDVWHPAIKVGLVLYVADKKTTMSLRDFLMGVFEAESSSAIIAFMPKAK